MKSIAIDSALGNQPIYQLLLTGVNPLVFRQNTSYLQCVVDICSTEFFKQSKRPNKKEDMVALRGKIMSSKAARVIPKHRQQTKYILFPFHCKTRFLFID